MIQTSNVEIHSNETFSSAMLEAVNYNNWIVDYFSPYYGDSVLEIGIGHGSFCDMLPKTVASYSGLDIDAQLVESARKRFTQNEYFIADLEDPNLALKDQAGKARQFDSIICFNVLEHISKDVQAARNMINMLKPGGHLLLFVPAFQALYTDMDRLAGHHRRYDKKMMRQVMPQDGSAQIIDLGYFNPIGGLGWYVNKLMSYDSLEDKKMGQQIRLFDKYILPISRLLNPLSKHIFGQSLVCVVKRTTK